MQDGSNQLEEDLRTAAAILEWESGDVFGHVGARLPEGRGVACRPFRVASAEEADWLVHFDFESNKIGGTGAPPLEWAIYTEIFRQRPDVQAVAHTHAPACIALSVAGREVMPIHMQSGRFGGAVPIYPRPIHIKDREEGGELARTLGDGKAIVIKGHGVVTVGRSVDDACMNALYLERTAKIQAFAQALGFTAPSKDHVREILESRQRLGGLEDAATSRAARGGYSNEWAYYRAKLRNGERWTRGWS